jgi:hypothetical protein
MYTRYSPRRLFAAVCVVAAAIVVPARAQQAPPDIRGVYYVSGAQSIYDCGIAPGATETTSPEATFPFSAYLSITSQDGSAFSGEIGFPQQQISIFLLTGQVSSEGLIEGLWSYGPDVTPPPEVANPVFTGEIVNGKVAIELTGAFVSSGASCQYRVALSSSSVTLTWAAPDTTSTDALPPPRQLVATPNPEPPAAKMASASTEPPAAAKAAAPRDGSPTGYNVYRSSMPGVQPTPQNLYTSVPATQTTVPAPDGTSGSFFVVTATYETGESGPSNEVSGGVPAATVTSVTPKGAKLILKGSDFSSPVQVFADGIPFVSQPRVKAGTKVVQKGVLATGETVAQYFTSGRTVTISVRNANGGVATKVYTRP